jgi:pilus assembly protein CpaB
MFNRRIVIVVGALVGAALAAVATWSYLQGADKRAYADATVVTVFRVAKPIPKGTPGEQAFDQSFIITDSIPQRFRPATALIQPSSIRGRLASSDLPVGQIVVDGQFVEPSLASNTFADRVPEGQVAISVQVDQVRGVAELIQPGDKVNMFTLAPDGERALMQNVTVIAVGTTAPPAPGANAKGGAAPAENTAGRGLVTFAVPPDAAARIAYATTGPVTKDAGVYLTLVHPKNKAVPIPVVNPGNLYSGPLTPYGP